MNEQIESAQKHINIAIELIGQALEVLKANTEPQKPEAMTVRQIQRYTSNSGNDTFKGVCDDEYQTIVYFRQAHKEVYIKAGLWEVLNALDKGEWYESYIEILVVTDGDFKRIVSVNPNFAIKEQMSE